MNSTVCFLMFLVIIKGSAGSMKFAEFRAKIYEKTALALASSSTSSSVPKKEGRVYYPIGYGADPSGSEDSSDAIMNALGDALGDVNSTASLELVSGVRDLGGVSIHFQGGHYKISKPIRFPDSIGNILVQGGTLRASDIFPGDRHLIELWSPNSQKRLNPSSSNFTSMKAQNNAGIYYEAITFSDILFDSTFRGGGLLIIDSARTRINNCFFLHFTTQGILVQKGHETYISNTFLGQHSTVGGDKHERDFSGTAIDLSSNDNAVTDVAIFSAGVGIILRGQANIVTGVHCYNKATYFGGVGILVKAAQSRISNCYLDYNSIVMEDPSQVHVTNGFFLGDGNIVLKSINGRISGLNIVNNMFCGNVKPIIELDGVFNNIDQVVIENNNVNGMGLKSTVGKLSVEGNGTRWTFDFSRFLIFPNRINHVQYSFYNVDGRNRFVGHGVTNVSGNVVVVESGSAVNAVVSMVVDQYNMVGEKSL